MSSLLFSYITLSLLLLQPFPTAEYVPAGPNVKSTATDSTQAVTIPINTDRSLILWKGTEMWQSGKHEGTVSLNSGYLTVKGDRITGGKFVADMNTITVTDIPEDDPVPRRRLRNHLKSEDFFYVEQYPHAIFEITSTDPFTTDSLKVWGRLTIRDVTKPISFIASKKVETDSSQGFHATLSFDRFAWNISYQGSYWERMTSILDNTFVDAEIYLTIHLITSSQKIHVQ